MKNDNIKAADRPADSLFSCNLFLTLKKEVSDNRKILLLAIAGIFGLCITIGTFAGFNQTGGGPGELSFFCVMSLVISCVVASLSFSNLKKKDTRISTLLIPDTMFDKFFVRWIAVVPLLMIVLIIGFYFVEFSRILVFRITHSPEVIAASGDYCTVMNPWNMLLKPMNDPSIASLNGMFFASYLLFQSVYLLGSVLWPKLSFIKTFAALWVLQTIASIVLLSVHIEVPKGVEIDGTTFFWSLAGIEFFFTLLFYILAYFRFRNTQVVYKLF